MWLLKAICHGVAGCDALLDWLPDRSDKFFSVVQASSHERSDLPDWSDLLGRSGLADASVLLDR